MRSFPGKTATKTQSCYLKYIPPKRSPSMKTRARLVHSIAVGMPRNRSAFLQSGAMAVWVIAVGFASYAMLNYDFTPGTASSAPSSWPESSALSRKPGQPTLLMFAHPRCPCTTASLQELKQVLAKSNGPVDCQIVFLMPDNATEKWRDSANVRAARAFKKAQVITDEGNEPRRFAVTTSGHVLLFDEQGHLTFSGGITGSRGHAGPNSGADMLLQSINQHRTAGHESPTFGCPLFHDNLNCRESKKCPI